MNRGFSGAWSVAERHLVRRSAVLLKAIERCCESVKCDENIHKLRVASRRLEAALNCFDALLSGKHLRRAKKQVRRIRRAAGRIRDLDVLILRLEEKSAAKSVIRALREQRRQLADDLLTELSDREQNRLRRDLKRLTSEHVPGPEAELRKWAAELMQPAACRFLDAAHHELRKTGDLHRLRLCGKRLRYSLELFKDQLDRDQVTPLLDSLRDFQERLGDMNDHASAHVLLSGVARSVPDPAVREVAHKLAKREKRSLKRDRRRFLRWWREGASRQIVECVQVTVPVDAAAAAAS